MKQNEYLVTGPRRYRGAKPGDKILLEDNDSTRRAIEIGTLKLVSSGPRPEIRLRAPEPAGDAPDPDTPPPVSADDEGV